MDVTQDEFAAMLGCSRQKVNSLMKEMEQEGIIRRHGRLVEIADPFLLMNAMEEDEPLAPELRTFIAEQRALVQKKEPTFDHHKTEDEIRTRSSNVVDRSQAKSPWRSSTRGFSLVAGIGFEPMTFRL